MNALTAEAVEGSNLQVVDLTPYIGTEVCGLDLSKQIDTATIAALRRVWLDRTVLVFRGQKLSQQDLVRFAKYFGEIGERGRSTDVFPSVGVLPEIMLISNVREN